MTTHELKLSTHYWDAVTTGQKTFEVRYNDRGYQKGDVLILREWGEGAYVSWGYERPWECRVTYVHSGLGMAPGYVVLGIEPVVGFLPALAEVTP